MLISRMTGLTLMQRFHKFGNALREEVSDRVIIHRTPEEVAGVIFGGTLTAEQSREATALHEAFSNPSARQKLSNAIPFGTYTGSFDELRDAYASMQGQGLGPASNPVSRAYAELITLGLTGQNAIRLMHAVGFSTENLGHLPSGSEAYEVGVEKLRKIQQIWPETFEAAIPEKVAMEFHADQAYSQDRS